MKNHWQKFAAVIAWAVSTSQANTYVIDTLGGGALQPIVQQQLNQLPNGGNVMVYQDRLVITTTPQNYATISQLIYQLEQLPQTLTIVVRVGETNANATNTGYGNIGVINNRVWVNGQWQNSQSQTTGKQLYQVQTLSGKPASIGLEQIISTPTVIVNGYRNAYPQIIIGNTLLSANQGISVMPTKLANGQIQVQIAQSNERFGSLDRQIAVNGQNLASTITVNPNQWTTIGYVSNMSQTSGGYGGYNQTRQTPIQLMVR